MSSSSENPPNKNIIKLSMDTLPDWVGLRLDKALAQVEEISSRTRALALIESKDVFVNGKNVKASHSLTEKDQIEIHIPEVPKDVGLLPYDFPLDILFEDSDLLIVNKPSGLVVHPAAGHEQDTLVNALLAHTKDLSMKFNEQRPGIVHRIDKETSGLLVIAKNDFAHEKLSVQFKDKTAHRVYKAVAWGKFLKPTGDIETTIARHPTHRKKFASLNSAVRFYQPSQSNATVKGSDVVDHKEDSAVGKWAFTSYKVLKQTSFFSYVELKLKTGRTHQIRVHLSELGHPLVGDHTYGADKKNKSANDKVQGQIKAADRFFLHAEQLGFLHPRTGKEMMFVADWPEKEKALLTDWGLL